MSSIQLTKHDYEILEYIAHFDSVSKNRIIEHFSGKVSAVEFRLSLLKKPDYNARVPYPLPNTNYIQEEFEETIDKKTGITSHETKNSFFITELGQKALQDYKTEMKLERKRIWLKNAWIPIVVTIAINLIKFALESLWPPIRVWLSNIP